MDGNLLATVLVGIGGIAGTLAGSLFSPRLSAAREQAAWLHRERLALYSDALAVAGSLRELAAALSDSDHDRRPPSALPRSREQIGVMMSLLPAHAEVRHAWEQLGSAEGDVRFLADEELHDQEDELTLRQVQPLLQAVETFERKCLESSKGAR